MELNAYHHSAIENHSTVDNAIDNRLSDNASFELVVPLRIWIQSAEYRRFGIASVFHKIQKEYLFMNMLIQCFLMRITIKICERIAVAV